MENIANKEIAVGVDGHKVSAFGWSHDHNTSMEFGDCEVLDSLMLQPNSKIKWRNKNFTRTKPLIRAPYAKMGLHTFACSVPIDSVFNKFSAMMTKTPVTDPFGNTYVPKHVPMIDSCELMNYCLAFSKVSVWACKDAESGFCKFENSVTFVQNMLSTASSKIDGQAFSGLQDKDVWNQHIMVELNANLRRPFNSYNPSSNMAITNWSGNTIFTDNLGISRSQWFADQMCFYSALPNYTNTRDKTVRFPLGNTMKSAVGLDAAGTHYVDPVVTPAGADFIEVRRGKATLNGTAYYFDYLVCYKMSNAGKRFCKLLRALGYPIENMTHLGYENIYSYNNTGIGGDSDSGQVNMPNHSDDGVGITVDVQKAPRKVSLLPLMAFYRGYYEFFGVQLQNAFENTNFYKLKSVFESNLYPDNLVTDTIVHPGSPSVRTAGMLANEINLPQNQAWYGWIAELYNLWYLEPLNLLNYLQANPLDKSIAGDMNARMPFDLANASNYGLGHDGTNPNSNAVNDWLSYSNGFVDVLNSLGTPVALSNGTPSDANSRPYYNAINHGLLDDKMLKILDKWTNRYSVIGHNIREAMRLSGHGTPNEKRDVYFVGHDYQRLNIDEITQSIDNYQEVNGVATGRPAGDVAGKSASLIQTPNWKWKSQGGYEFFFAFQVVVPESGYCEGVSPEIHAVDPMSFPQPEFDGLGLEAIRYEQFFGQAGRFKGKFAGGATGEMKARTIGYAPRMSAWKFPQNRINGDFANYSTRLEMSTYHMDKMPLIDDVRTGAVVTASDGSHGVALNGGNFMANLPKAGLWYRFPWRYKGLSNFERIFIDGSTDAVLTPDVSGVGTSNTNDDMCECTMDIFICNNAITAKYEAPMVPFALSYETFDDEKGANSSVDYGK